MKKIVVLLFLVVGVITTSRSQIIRTIEMSKSAYNNSGDTLHHIANNFSDSVGILLKQYYPARIHAVYVELNFNEKTKLFTLSYFAEIERCKVNERDWFFEHAGALSFDYSLSVARKNALTRMKEQSVDRQEQFLKIYGNCGSAGGYHYDSAKSGTKYWVIYEKFLVAR